MSVRRIFLRRDTAANWSVTSPNPIILAEGEPGFDTTNQILKIGDGVTAWNDLAQFQGPTGATGPAGADGVDGVSINTYTKANLPLAATAGTNALVTDGTIGGTPTMSYFYNGVWYRTFDNSVITNQTIDLFILAGQSNAHGHADVSDLSSAQATQDGLFYTSWHDNTTNAETTQYYSDWATSLVAGSTRGDDSSSTLGNSSYFGSEMGFVSRANAINLTTQPIGIIKYGVGASELEDGNTSKSDWDTTATGSREGDCYRGLLSALSDATTKLTNAGYSWNFKGMIWWQGEAGASVNGLNTFISAVRTLLGNSYGVANSSQFPVVITKIGITGATDLTPVADADNFIGIVDAGNFGQSSQTHVGKASEGSSDTTGNGVNDMFDIGEAYADEMVRAISGNTGTAGWLPSDDHTSTTLKLWLDASDLTTAGSTWDDKSGNSNHATKNNTPSIVTNAQNGLAVMRYVARAGSTTDYHEWTDLTDIRTVFGVFARDTGNEGSIVNDDGVYHFFASAGSTLVHPTLAHANIRNGTYKLDGTSVDPTTTNHPNTFSLHAIRATGNVEGSRIGWDRTQTTVYRNLDGDYGELLIFNTALTDAEIEKVEGYLAHKWGLTADLPSSHPYKTTAP